MSQPRGALRRVHLPEQSAWVTNVEEPRFKSGEFTDSAAGDGAYWSVRKFPEGAAIALSHEHDRDIDVFMDRDTAVAFAHALLWAVDAESS
jgi:hypothetical protein